MNGNVLFEIKDLQKKFGSLTVFDGLRETICKGDVVVIIGPSGGGKSTFIRCLNLLEQTTAGKIYFEGEDITAKGFDVNRHRQKVGMVFQQFNLFNNLTILENVTISLKKVKKVPAPAAEEKARALLRRVGLEDKADAYPAQLSGGQKQRLAIARALARNPEILIFDDSFSALDYKTDAALRKGLAEKLGGVTCMIVAQRIGTIRNADKIVVLDEGKAVGIGTHEELIKNCAVYREIAMSQLSAEELGA